MDRVAVETRCGARREATTGGGDGGGLGGAERGEEDGDGGGLETGAGDGGGGGGGWTGGRERASAESVGDEEGEEEKGENGEGHGDDRGMEMRCEKKFCARQEVVPVRFGEEAKRNGEVELRLKGSSTARTPFRFEKCKGVSSVSTRWRRRTLQYCRST